MLANKKREIDRSRAICALRHIESGEYICLRHEGHEYLASFSDGDSAFQFREELGLVEHVDICRMRVGEAPFEHFWIDGEMAVSEPTAGSILRG